MQYSDHCNDNHTYIETELRTHMELRGGVEIPIALWGGLERRMGTMTRVLQAARYE